MKSAFTITEEDILTVRAERARKNKKNEIIYSRTIETSFVSRCRDTVISIFKTEVEIVTSSSFTITHLSKDEINETWKRIVDKNIAL